MKVRLARAALFAALAAAVFFTAPPPQRSRQIAIVRVHPPGVRPASPLAPQPVRLTPESAIQVPQQIRATTHAPVATPRPLRPIFPWWFKRRHVAAPQAAIA